MTIMLLCTRQVLEIFRFEAHIFPQIYISPPRNAGKSAFRVRQGSLFLMYLQTRCRSIAFSDEAISAIFSSIYYNTPCRENDLNFFGGHLSG